MIFEYGRLRARVYPTLFEIQFQNFGVRIDDPKRLCISLVA
jgi:hypothetical protein